MASVKNGFVPATRRKVYAALHKLKVEECPFSNLPEMKGTHKMDLEKMRKVTWVESRVLLPPQPHTGQSRVSGE